MAGEKSVIRGYMRMVFMCVDHDYCVLYCVLIMITVC